MNLTQESINMPEKRTFVVNTNSKLISSLESLNEKDTNLCKKIIKHLYDLSMLSQKELSKDEIQSFISRSNNILEKLL